MSFDPYLMFGGNCRQAFTRYQEIFGGELFLMPVSEAPPDEGLPAEAADMIIHAALTLGENLLMASDDPTGGAARMEGIFVNYTAEDVGEAERVFNALAEGGEVTSPLAETFFSPKFGMCRDRFGVPWMVNTRAPEQSP